MQSIFAKGGDQKTAMLTKFNITGDIVTNLLIGDFMSLIADAVAGGIQNGARTTLCKTVLSKDFDEDPIGQMAGISSGLDIGDYNVQLANTTIDINKNMR